MLDWLQRLVKRLTRPASVSALERELHQLRRALQECEARLQHAQAHLQHTQQTEQARTAAQTDALITAFLNELATPLTQLATQLHLIQQGESTLSPVEVLKTARRILTALEAWGVQLEGQIGATEPYDPTRHLALNAAVSLQAGQPVVVRLCGLSYKGTLIRKLGVEPA